MKELLLESEYIDFVSRNIIIRLYEINSGAYIIHYLEELNIPDRMILLKKEFDNCYLALYVFTQMQTNKDSYMYPNNFTDIDVWEDLELEDV